MTLSEELKQKISQEIIKNFLENEDVADYLMGVAIELTEPVISQDSKDLFSEVSGMVGYTLAELVRKGAAQTPSPSEDLPTRVGRELGTLISEGVSQTPRPTEDYARFFDPEE